MDRRRQRTQTKASAEDHALDQIAKEAEARLAARRQARAEAREIRMREIERQQREQDETPKDRPPVVRHSRRSSEEDPDDHVKEAEDKFRKAMILNAQLDNDKAALAYQLELLKDDLEDLRERHSQLQREHRDRCRAHEAALRERRAAAEDLERCSEALALRDRCIREAGMELAVVEPADGDAPVAALVSRAGMEALEGAGEGTLDVRLRRLAEERRTLAAETRRLRAQLEEERDRRRRSPTGDGEGSDADSDRSESQREASKLLADYRFRASKAEQDALTLQATVARLEGQVARYRTAVEDAERTEDELKCDRRKLQREAREALSRVEELETENGHLNRRLDKLKNAKSALLKEL